MSAESSLQEESSANKLQLNDLIFKIPMQVNLQCQVKGNVLVNVQCQVKVLHIITTYYASFA